MKLHQECGWELSSRGTRLNQMTLGSKFRYIRLARSARAIDTAKSDNDFDSLMSVIVCKQMRSH